MPYPLLYAIVLGQDAQLPVLDRRGTHLAKARRIPPIQQTDRSRVTRTRDCDGMEITVTTKLV